MKNLIIISIITLIFTQVSLSIFAGTNKNQLSFSHKNEIFMLENKNSSQLKKKNTQKLTKDDFLKKIWDYNTYPQTWKYKGNKPALIDFYADWCRPCRIASPILEEIAKEYSEEINVYKVDTQTERELTSVFGIQSLPSFVYIPLNGKPIMISGISNSAEETKKMFKDNISKYLLSEDK